MCFFFPRKVALAWTHTRLELSESFINRPTLGRQHLCLSIAFLGWVPELPDSWTITCSFHATFCLFYRTRGPFIPEDPLGKHACVLSEQRFKTCGEFSVLTVHSDSGLCRRREPLMPPIPFPLIPAPPPPLFQSCFSFSKPTISMSLVLTCLSSFLLGILDHHFQPSPCGER